MNRPLSPFLCALALLAASPPAWAEDDEVAPEAAPDAAPEATPADDLAALRAELAAQRARIEELEAADVQDEYRTNEEPPLRIYGFMEAGFQKLFMREGSLGWAALQSDATTFVLGNVNLYVDAQPLEGWRGLFEIRLTNSPDGTDFAGWPGSPYQRVSTQVFDPTSSNGGWSVIRWGALVLERAHIEWRHSDYLTVRAGLFLTPAGIWNVDHGSPTLIALHMPQFLVLEMFPPRQTGLQILGTYHFAPWAFEYTAYVSNGRQASQIDPTEDKAFGGRLVLRRGGPTRLALGTSFYAGRYSEQERNLVLSSDSFAIERTESVAYDEQTVGVDVSLDVGKLRLRAEGALRHIIYDQGKRNSFFGYPGFYNSDRNEIDAYVLAAYQLPWLGLEPYLNVEVVRIANLLGDGEVVPSVGCNVHLTAAATLKLQVSHTRFVGDWAQDSSNLTLAAARAVLAF